MFLRRSAVPEYRRRREAARRVGGTSTGCGAPGGVPDRRDDPGRGVRERAALAAPRVRGLPRGRAGPLPLASHCGPARSGWLEVAVLRPRLVYEAALRERRLPPGPVVEHGARIPR